MLRRFWWSVRIWIGYHFQGWTQPDEINYLLERLDPLVFDLETTCED